jgi:hypothetical protein
VHSRRLQILHNWGDEQLVRLLDLQSCLVFNAVFNHQESIGKRFTNYKYTSIAVIHQVFDTIIQYHLKVFDEFRTDKVSSLLKSKIDIVIRIRALVQIDAESILG